MIYIAVWVSYDYSRFQTNFYANIDKSKVLEYIKNNPKPSGYNYPDLPIHEYPLNDPPPELHAKEIEHWWIQEFKEEK